MIYSMTAFSVAEEISEQLSVNIELRSYNSKQLDISLRMPYGYLILEEKIRSRIAEKITRGRIEIKIQIKNNFLGSGFFEINIPKAKAYYDALNRLKDELGIKDKISLELLTRNSDIISQGEINEKESETAWNLIRSCLDKAIYELNNMRKKEGDFIAGDLIKRIDYIRSCLAQIEEKTDGLLAFYQDRLKERIRSLIKGEFDIDPVRIAQEAAIIADKSDISEEITRAESHIEQFLFLIGSEEPAGRKLNFLLQEFNREFNTLGSKAGNAEVSHIIVDVKAEVEKIREQVQNIE